jgi:hypothetical protein
MPAIPVREEDICAPFAAVFAAADPFDTPFTERVPHRMLLYPVDYELSQEQLEIVSIAARALGDDGFYLALLEGTESDRNGQWLLKIGDVQGYLDVAPAQENAIFSPAGRWGLIFSHESHALLGSCRRFIEVFRQHLWRSEADQTLDFLQLWKKQRAWGASVDWIEPMLQHLYGAERAQELLNVARFEASE